MRSAAEAAVQAMNATFHDALVQRIVEEAPAEPQEMYRWMEKEVPEFGRMRKERPRHPIVPDAKSARELAPGKEHIWMTTDGQVFDIIAKKYLVHHQQACKSIFHIDLLLVYGGVSVCYRVHLTNAHGGIEGQNNVFARCNVDVAAWGTTSVCIRNPCGSDPCASHSIGLGLRGPLNAGLSLAAVRKVDDDSTNLLKLTGYCEDFPGLYIIGLPGVLGDIVNKILNAATSFLLEHFIDALLKHLTLYVVKVPLRIPRTHVRLEIQDFDVETSIGRLILAAKPKFKEV